MSMSQILSVVRGFDGVLELAPTAGSETPQIAWGDHFFYFAPDGVTPTSRQPYATIVTKDYPDDSVSRLGPGRWRVNIHVGRARSAQLTSGNDPDPSQVDVIVPHPLYGASGWISVVNPGERTRDVVLQLLLEAHLADRHRVERRR